MEPHRTREYSKVFLAANSFAYDLTNDVATGDGSRRVNPQRTALHVPMHLVERPPLYISKNSMRYTISVTKALHTFPEAVKHRCLGCFMPLILA